MVEKTLKRGESPARESENGKRIRGESGPFKLGKSSRSQNLHRKGTQERGLEPAAHKGGESCQGHNQEMGKKKGEL